MFQIVWSKENSLNTQVYSATDHLKDNYDDSQGWGEDKRAVHEKLFELIRQDNPKHSKYMTIFLLDAERLNSSTYFIETLGAEPSKIFVANFCASKEMFERAALSGIHLIPCSVDAFLEHVDPTLLFDFVFLDYCATFTGNQSTRSCCPRDDVEKWFKKGQLNRERCILAITVCTRGDSPNKIENQLLSEIPAIAASFGYFAEICWRVLYKRQMLSMIFRIIGRVHVPHYFNNRFKILSPAQKQERDEDVIIISDDSEEEYAETDRQKENEVATRGLLEMKGTKRIRVQEEEEKEKQREKKEEEEELKGEKTDEKENAIQSGRKKRCTRQNVEEEPNSKEPDREICKVCKAAEPDEHQHVIRCDQCKEWWHQLCHEPPIVPRPLGSFFCSSCKEEEEDEQEEEEGSWYSLVESQQPKVYPDADKICVPIGSRVFEFYRDKIGIVSLDDRKAYVALTDEWIVEEAAAWKALVLKQKEKNKIQREANARALAFEFDDAAKMIDCRAFVKDHIRALAVPLSKNDCAMLKTFYKKRTFHEERLFPERLALSVLRSFMERPQKEKTKRKNKKQTR